MRNFNLTLSAPGESIRCLIDAVEKVKDGDLTTKITVIVNDKFTGNRLKLSVRDYLRCQSDDQQVRASSSDICHWSQLLFNVTFTTSDILIKELWQQNTLQPDKAILSDFAIRYASGIGEGTRAEFGLYRDVIPDLYGYVRYKSRPKSIRAVLNNFSSKEIEEYIDKIHSVTAQSHIDKTDMLEELITNMTGSKNNILSNELTNIIVFLPQKINYLEEKFYQALLGEYEFAGPMKPSSGVYTHRETSDNKNQGLFNFSPGKGDEKPEHLEIICSELQKDLLLQEMQPGHMDTDSFRKKLYEKLCRYQNKETLRQSAIKTQNNFLSEADIDPVSRWEPDFSQKESDHQDYIPKNIISTQNNLSRQTFHSVSTDKALTLRQELHKALEWITNKIADGLNPMNCAIVYFAADRYQESILYETAALQVDYFIYNTGSQRKNLFCELALALFGIDKKSISSAAIIELLSYAFLMSSDKSEFLIAADIISDMSIEIGSIEYWSYVIKNSAGDTENSCKKKISALLDIFKEYLKDRDSLDNVVSISNWLSSLVADCYMTVTKVPFPGGDHSYDTFQKVLLELRSLALVKEKITREDALVMLMNISINYDPMEIKRNTGILIAPIEEISYFSFDAVAILGCTANFIDSKQFINEYKYVCDSIYSESKAIRFSYPVYDSTGKRRGSIAGFVKDYVKASEQESATVTYDTRIIEESSSNFTLMSYGDMLAHCLSNMHGQSIEDLKYIGMPPALVFSLESFENRSDKSFNDYMGKVGKDILANQSFTYSPTSLEEYLNCPFRYFLHRMLNVKGEDRRDNSLSYPPNKIGLLIHKILEIYVKVLMEVLSTGNLTFGDLKFILGNFYSTQNLQSFDDRLGLCEELDVIDVYSNDILLAIIDIEFNKLRQGSDYILSPLIARLKKRWTYYLMLWHNSYIELLADNYKTLAAEWAFKDKRLFDINNNSIPFILSGFIDRIDIDANGTLYIIDYKTGSPDKYQKLNSNERKLSGFLQLPLYALAYSEEMPSPIFYSRYEFLSQPEKNISLLIDDDLIAELHNCVESACDLIQHGIFPQNPGERSQTTFTNCRNCSYTAVCSDAQKSLWPTVKEDTSLAKYLEI